MCRFFVTPSTKEGPLVPPFATSLRKASPKWPQLSLRDLSKTVGRHMEARREWNEVVSTKNMRQIESKQSQKNTTCPQKCLFGCRSPHLCCKVESPKWPQLSPRKEITNGVWRMLFRVVVQTSCLLFRKARKRARKHTY